MHSWNYQICETNGGELKLIPPDTEARAEQIADIPTARRADQPKGSNCNRCRLTFNNIGESVDHEHFLRRLILLTLANYIKGLLPLDVDHLEKPPPPEFFPAAHSQSAIRCVPFAGPAAQ